MNESERQLLDLYLDGELPDDESTALLACLEKDPQAVVYLAERALLLSDLRRSVKRRNLQQWAVASTVEHMEHHGTARARSRFRWLQWRPLTSAAAGILFGMLCASVVFGYMMPRMGKAMTLLQESFESGPAPLVTGRPDKAGVWSGDYSEIVSEQQGLQPKSGKTMLRFLRADFEGRTIPESFSSDVFRLFDVRPYGQEFADGGAVVQLSTVFNAAPFGDGESYKCGLTIFALDAALVDGGLLNADHVLATQSLAKSTSSHLHMDRAPATWQRLGNELRVPPNTDYLLIQIGVSNVSPPNGMRRDSFSGHFVDDVKLVFAQRPEIALP